MANDLTSSGMGSQWTVTGMGSTPAEWLQQADGTMKADGTVTREELKAALNQVCDSLGRIDKGSYFQHDNPVWKEQHTHRLEEQKKMYEQELRKMEPQPASSTETPAAAASTIPAAPAPAPSTEKPAAAASPSPAAPAPAPSTEKPALLVSSKLPNEAKTEVGKRLASVLNDSTPQGTRWEDEFFGMEDIDAALKTKSLAPKERAILEQIKADISSGKLNGQQLDASQLDKYSIAYDSALFKEAKTEGGKGLAQVLDGSTPEGTAQQDRAFGMEDIDAALKTNSLSSKERAILEQIKADISSGKLNGQQLDARQLDKYSIAYDLWSSSGGSPETKGSGPQDLAKAKDLKLEGFEKSVVDKYLEINSNHMDGIGDDKFNDGKGYGLGDVAQWVNDAMYRLDPPGQ